jgi:hypothetical protein
MLGPTCPPPQRPSTGRLSHDLEALSDRRRAAVATPGSLEERVWSVFTRLARLAPELWLVELARRALRLRLHLHRRELDTLRVSIWEPVAPPPARQAYLRRQALRGKLAPPAGRLRRGRVTPLSILRQDLAQQALEGRPLEAPYELGAVLRTSRRVFYILPVLEAELEMEVSSDRRRDAILRALDAGLYEAEAGRVRPRRFYLILLYRDRKLTPLSVERLRFYRETSEGLRRKMPHRRKFDAESVRRHLGLLRWKHLAAVALEPQGTCPGDATLRADLLNYLRQAGLFPMRGNVARRVP